MELEKVFLKITLLILLFNGVEVFSFESNIDTSYDSTKYSLNKMQIENSADTVSFLAGGHLYGSPRWKGSLFPSPSILGNIETATDLHYDSDVWEKILNIELSKDFTVF